MMKQTLVLCGLAVFMAVRVAAVDAVTPWLTDLPQAKEQAKKENKRVLINFTGSDWCSWCIKIKKEILDTKEFKAYAAKNLVLVELDFPNRKAQSPQLKKANAALQDEFSVGGFPTFVVLGSNGKEVGRQVGYLKGGVSAFTGKIDGFAAK